MRRRNCDFVRENRCDWNFLNSSRRASALALLFTRKLQSRRHHAARQLQRRPPAVRRPRLAAAAHRKYLSRTLQCLQYHSGRVPIPSDSLINAR